jgi:rhodanese-related sulfurtransferase
MNAIKGMMLGMSIMGLALVSSEMMAQCCGAAKKSEVAAPMSMDASSVAVEAVASPAVQYITREKLQEMMSADQDLLIVDVLDAASFAKRHIKGSVNVPLAGLEAEMSGYFAAIPKDRSIVVYCASQRCKASTKAAELLMANGFTHVVDYENGLAEWVDSGLAVGSGDVCASCDKAKGQPGCCVSDAAVCPVTGEAPACTKEKGAGCKMGQAGCAKGKAADAAQGETGACMAPVPLPTE